jgi:Fe-Mn family superoxide dismutase
MPPINFTLPSLLPYAYDALEPVMSQEQLMIHHQKHHNAYVVAANELIAKLDEARQTGTDLDMKSVLKSLSFNIGGLLMHSLFWENLAPVGSGGEPEGALKHAIEKGFGSLERLKREFTQAALSVEGSGWAALFADSKKESLLVMQIEKHTVNTLPDMKTILVLDMFEHAFYVDHKNDKAKYAENFWQIANWKKAGERYDIH